MAAPLSFTSFVHQAPHVYLAQILPVATYQKYANIESNSKPKLKAPQTFQTTSERGNTSYERFHAKQVGEEYAQEIPKLLRKLIARRLKFYTNFSYQ
jgi:hypothetical protein